MKFKPDLFIIFSRKYGPPQITAWGEAVWPEAEEKFVKDAKTGKILVRTRDVKYLGKSSKGFNFYFGSKSKLGVTDKAIPSFV